MSTTLLLLLSGNRAAYAEAVPAVQAEFLRAVQSEQMGIAFFGVAAIWLSQDTRENVRRWACWCGLAAQPFWFYTTFTHQQWAVFALSFFYTWSWIKGVRSYWVPLWRPWIRRTFWRHHWVTDGNPYRRVCLICARRETSYCRSMETWSHSWWEAHVEGDPSKHWGPP